MEHVELICRSDSKLFSISISSIRIHSRKRDISEKPLQHIPNPLVSLTSGTTSLATARGSTLFVRWIAPWSPLLALMMPMIPVVRGRGTLVLRGWGAGWRLLRWLTLFVFFFHIFKNTLQLFSLVTVHHFNKLVSFKPYSNLTFAQWFGHVGVRIAQDRINQFIFERRVFFFDLWFSFLNVSVSFIIN